MPRHPLRLAATLLLALLPCHLAVARLVAVPDLRRLTDASNTIVVAEVLADQTLGPTTLRDRAGNTSPGEQHLVSLRIDEVLAGTAVPTSLAVPYGFNPQFHWQRLGVQTPRFTPGETLLLFLHCATPSACTTVDVNLAGVPVTRERNPIPTTPPDDTPYLRVLQRIASGLFATPTPPAPAPPNTYPLDPRVSVVHLLAHQTDTPYLLTLLRAALARAPLSEELRTALLATLLRRGDTSVLPAIATALSHIDPTLPLYAYSNLLYPLEDVPWQQSLPIAALALHASDPHLRQAAAGTLPRLRLEHAQPFPNPLTAPATHLLLPLLHDADPDVVYSTMLSLADLNARPDQRPSQASFPPPPCPTCLDFWRSFPDPTPAPSPSQP